MLAGGSASAYRADNAARGPGVDSSVSPEVIAHDRALREQLGFRSDADYIERLYDGKVGDISREGVNRLDYDFLMTPAEHAELSRRNRVSRDSAPLEELAERGRPGLYANSYVDHKRNGVLVVQLAGKQDDLPADARELLAGIPHTVETVPRSAKALKQERRDARAQRYDLARDGFRLMSIGFDLTTNGLTFEVVGDVAKAEQRLRDLLPNTPLTVSLGQEKPAGVLKADLPFRGGVGNRNNTDGGGCTNGFVGYRQTVPTTYYMITAGHCGKISDRFGQDVLSGAPDGYGRMGYLEARSFYEGSPGDAARISIDNAAYRSPNVVLNPNTSRAMARAAGVGTYGNGAYVCVSTTRWRDSDGDYFNCGTVTDGSYDYAYNDKYNVRFSSEYGRKGTYKCTEGDSGGPALDYDTAVGIMVSFGSDNSCNLTHIYDALRGTGVAGIITG